ncbi:YbjN domain-containing protein [Catenulispora sp. NF23]|uniref:YbjN domain-containing protein n=1 Tax=Catenulispora pinistramenti TaxID=2705254 RepID=UPI001BA94BCD|nr:YbjN domain-containing protein [Catenulispora pinistramenti]MBS2537062.1 YbjN domain-containing protein [Catenulispora pinistramenti]
MGGDREGIKAAARSAVLDALADAGVEYERPEDGTFVVKLPGEHKLWTTCSLVVGDHTLSLNAFVARRPDENHEGVYRWLLERNTRLGSLAFALDRLGDVYLVGRLPLGLITPEVVDQLLGEAVAASDSSFDQLLELGFASAIRREWEWRTSRGESLANLAAFRHLIERTPDTRDENGPEAPK